MNIVATVQARMGSTRLPGKVLKKVCGKPLLQYQIERIRRSRLVDQIVIATTINPKDDEIVKLASKLGVSVYRGSEDDVLGRIVGLLQTYEVDLHVELIGDSPLTDPQIVDEIIGVYLKNAPFYDYVSNGTEVTYPAGVEVNVYPARVLIEAEKNVPADSSSREHVDIHICKNDRYRCLCVKAPDYFHNPEIFLEIDTEKDFQMMSAVISNFVVMGKEYFSLAQILDFLTQHPEIVKINQNEDRNYWQFKDKPIFIK